MCFLDAVQHSLFADLYTSASPSYIFVGFSHFQLLRPLWCPCSLLLFFSVHLIMNSISTLQSNKQEIFLILFHKMFPSTRLTGLSISEISAVGWFWKQLFRLSFEPKINWCFLISALAFKKWIGWIPFLIWPILDTETEIKNKNRLVFGSNEENLILLMTLSHPYNLHFYLISEIVPI